MQEELRSHEQCKTWSIVKRQDDMNVIGTKWVYKKSEMVTVT